MTEGAGLLPCPDCGREFRGKAGVSQHRRRAHKEAYHQDHVPEHRKKARWVYEQKVLLARVEKNMVELGLTVTSKTMAEQFPSRSSESIKKMRQSVEYKGILESLTGAHGTQDGPAGGSASSLAGLGTQDSRVDEGDSSEAHATFLWRLWMMSGMLGKYYFSKLSNVIFHQNNLNLSATHRG